MTVAEHDSDVAQGGGLAHPAPNVWRILGEEQAQPQVNAKAVVTTEEDIWGDSTQPAWEKYPLVGPAELAAPIKPARWLIERVWIQKSSGVVAGKKKAFKTWQMHSTALAIVTGRRFLDKFAVVTPGPVVYLTGEGGQDEFMSRHQAIARRYGVNADEMRDIPFRAMFHVAALDNDEFTNALRHHLDTVQPVAVYLDPLYAYHPADVDISSVYSRGQMLATIREEIEPYAALIIGDHINKSASNTSLDLDDIGFSGVSQWADSWSIQRHREKFRTEGPNSYAKLEVEFGSRRTGSMRYNVDWNLTRDTSDPTSIKWAACDWAVIPNRDGQVVTPPDAKTDVLRAKKQIVQMILAGIEDGDQCYTKTELQEAVQAQSDIPRRRVKEAWDELVDAKALESLRQERVGADGKVRSVDVWTVVPKWLD